jgi:Right handed beta helix region
MRGDRHHLVCGLSLVVLVVGVLCAGASTQAAPRLAQAKAQAGPKTIAVPAGGDLQAAIDRAAPGDTLTLAPGATYTGPITLPKKSGEAWIVIKTAAPDGEFPAAGKRVTPAHARQMPKIVAANGSVIVAAPGAHHYRFVGIEIAPKDGVFLRDVIDLGGNAASLDGVPSAIAFERCYIHGDKAKGSRRGIALNGKDLSVVDSHLSDFKEVGADSQAIAGWNGPGPFSLVNNYLEAAGENVMFGGADPTIPDLVPSDIEIRKNHIAKPLSWKSGEPGYEGKQWTVKNLLELKNARRVMIEGNLIEGNWMQAQNGFAVLFTVRNQDGNSPWSTIEDVTFVNNVVRHATSGVNILGRDDIRPSQAARRITIKNNLFADIGGPRWGGGGTLFQILNGASQVVIENNTAVHTGSIILSEGPPQEAFVFRRNIVVHNSYGIIGTDTGPGNSTLARYFPGAVIEGNVIAGGDASRYPRGNHFPGSLTEVRFVDQAGGNYRLADGSRFKKGGAGVDFEALAAAGALDAAERGAR